MQPWEHWIPHADQLARQLVDQSGKAIAQRLMDTLAHEAKTRKPVQLEALGCENHWQEITTVARVWGGPAPFDYQEVERNIVHFFLEDLHRMPGHEQALMYASTLTMERLAADGLDSFSAVFRLEPFEIDSLLSALFEQLMSVAHSGLVSDEFEPNEVDRLWDANAALESQLKYFKRAHQVLAEGTAFDVCQRLVTQLCAEAKISPAFDIASEGCETHWDEIRIMANQGSDHILFDTLLSTLENSAWRAIQKLPEREKYALWVDSDDGKDWVNACDGEDFPDEPYMGKSGLLKAAQAIARDVWRAACE